MREVRRNCGGVSTRYGKYGEREVDAGVGLVRVLQADNSSSLSTLNLGGGGLAGGGGVTQPSSGGFAALGNTGKEKRSEPLMSSLVAVLFTAVVQLHRYQWINSVE